MGLIWVGWVILIRGGNACVRSGEDGNLWEGCSLSSPARAVWKETAAHFPDERQRPDCFHDVLIITTLVIVIVITFVIVIIIIKGMVLWVKMWRILCFVLQSSVRLFLCPLSDCYSHTPGNPLVKHFHCIQNYSQSSTVSYSVKVSIWEPRLVLNKSPQIIVIALRYIHSFIHALISWTFRYSRSPTHLALNICHCSHFHFKSFLIRSFVNYHHPSPLPSSIFQLSFLKNRFLDFSHLSLGRSPPPSSPSP